MPNYLLIYYSLQQPWIESHLMGWTGYAVRLGWKTSTHRMPRLLSSLSVACPRALTVRLALQIHLNSLLFHCLLAYPIMMIYVFATQTKPNSVEGTLADGSSTHRSERRSLYMKGIACAPRTTRHDCIKYRPIYNCPATWLAHLLYFSHTASGTVLSPYNDLR